MNFYAYWETLEQELDALLVRFPALDYASHPPQRVARAMAEISKPLNNPQARMGELRQRGAAVLAQEARLGTRQDGIIILPLECTRDFFFAWVYWRHQQRYADT